MRTPSARHAGQRAAWPRCISNGCDVMAPPGPAGPDPSKPRAHMFRGQSRPASPPPLWAPRARGTIGVRFAGVAHGSPNQPPVVIVPRDLRSAARGRGCGARQHAELDAPRRAMCSSVGREHRHALYLPPRGRRLPPAADAAQHSGLRHDPPCAPRTHALVSDKRRLNARQSGFAAAYRRNQTPHAPPTGLETRGIGRGQPHDDGQLVAAR